MTYNVILCGLGNKGEVRPVFFSDYKSDPVERVFKGRASLKLAEQVYLNGQNEIQCVMPFHKNLRSVSMGDIIVLPDKEFGDHYYKVESKGFTLMGMRQAYEYIASFR